MFVFSGENPPVNKLPPEIAQIAEMLFAEPSFRGKKGKIVKALLPGKGFSRLWLAGLGERKSFTEDTLRSAAAGLMRSAGAEGITRVSAMLPVPPDRSLSIAAAEGAELGVYSFDRYKTKKEEDALPEPEEFIIFGGDEDGLSLGKIMAQTFARNLANEPQQVKPCFAGAAVEMAMNWGSAEVWDETKF